MSAWGRHTRSGIAAALLLVLVLSPPARSAGAPREPDRPAPTPPHLRAEAEAAERAGDWEAAFAAYCRLFVADRLAPDVREKLNNALRRVQQDRRHRDPAFRQFTQTLSVGDALGLFAEVVTKVPAVYADRDRATPQRLWEHGAEELDRALGSPTFRHLYLDPASVGKLEEFRASLRVFWSKRPVANAREARAALRQLIAAAQDTCPVRVPAALAVEFVCGACAGLDEYTVFLDPGRFTPDPSAAAADLSGYGLYLGPRGGGLVVEGVAVGSWAAFHTPLHRGDRVVRVNGQPMTGGDMADALRTPLSGFHELEVEPADPELPYLRVQLPLAVPTVYGADVVGRDGVGYIRVGGFQPSTPRELDAAIADLRVRGMRSLVLDLRGNHGGAFLPGVEAARRLLPAGIIVTTQGQLGEVASRVFSSDSGPAALVMPLVVLIDSETASAAEVLAAALKDNNRAVLIGMPSFGKGAILYPLKLTAADEVDEAGQPRPRSGGVHVTIARLISPRGAAINGAGVTPHVIEPDPVQQLRLAIERAAESLAPAPRSPAPTVPPLAP
jgi:carboxyl-terminal processing protease